MRLLASNADWSAPRTTLFHSQKISYYTGLVAAGDISISVLYPLPQNPSRLGDLVSVSFRVFRKNWRYMTGRLLTLSLLASVSVTIMQASIINWTQSLKNGSGLALYDLGLFSFGVVLVFVSQYFLALRSTALYREVFGIAPDFKQAMEYANRRRWAVFIVFSISASTPVMIGLYLAPIFLTVFLIRMGGPWLGQSVAEAISLVAGILMIVLWVVLSALTLLYATLLFAAVSSEDDMKFGRLFSRAYELTMRYPMRGGSYMCLLGLAILLVLLAMSIFATPFSIFEAVKTAQNPDITTPFYLQVLETISQTLNNVVSMGVAVTAAGLYYRDVRFRSEGADLLEKLDALKPREPLDKLS